MRKDRTGTTLTGGRESKLDKEVIRRYEDPEYRKAAEEYEKKARSARRRRRSDYDGFDDELTDQDAKRAEQDLYDEMADDELSEGYSRRRAKKRHQQERREAERERLEQLKEKARSGKDALIHKAKDGAGKPGKKKTFKRIRNIIIIILIIIALIIGYFMFLTSHLDRVDTSESDFAIDPKVADELSGYRNIAVLGVDARAGEGYDGSRTDAIIVLSIKKSTGDIKMISVMRDSYIKIADADGNLMLDKVTHAHHYGGGVDTCAALNRSLDMNISEFMIFNWKAVSDAVDALGGIDVNVKKNEIRDLNHWGPETAENVGGTYKKITSTGEQTIDGVQATTYCRIRKTSGGDTGRTRRYKKVMSAVMKKAMTSPLKLYKLGKDVLPEIRTNMSQGQLLTAMLRAPGYEIKKNIGWPKDYYGGIIFNGLWNAVPTTLESNVKWLHRKAFEQSNYKPSKTCLDISQEIINTTGLY